MGDASDTEQLAAALEQGAGARRLDDQLVLEVSGEDAHEWLGGQVTNAVRSTEPGDAVYALFTNVKGKVLADAWILHVDHGEEHDTLWAVVPAGTREALLESFDKYIVMEDVEVRPREDLAVLTVQGPEAAKVADAVDAADVTTWACDRLGTDGVDLIVPLEQADAVLSALTDAGAAAVTEEAWELARVRRGVPRYGRDFDSAHYPQETGLAPRAVSFTKGCYVGQEVVCMLESRGKLSKKLVALELPSDGQPEPASPLTADEGDPKEVGRLTSVAADRALGWVKAARAEPGTELFAGNTRVRVIGDAR